MQKLSDVLREEKHILSYLKGKGTVGISGKRLFDSVRMDKVLVLSDLFLKRYLECSYCYNTHIVPHCLPAAGITVGDIIESERTCYLVINGTAMFADLVSFQMFRKYEAEFMFWFNNYEQLNQKVLDFIVDIHSLDPECFDIDEFSCFTQITSNIGWTEVNLPSNNLVKALYNFAERRTTSASNILERAYNLALELEPFVHLLPYLKKIKEDVGHNGFPLIKDALIQLSAPATIANVLIHSCVPNDYLDGSLMNSNDLMTFSMHRDAGSTKGERFFMHPPRSEFFSALQANIDSDSELEEIWRDEDYSRSTGNIQEVANATVKWRNATLASKYGLVARIVPGLVSNYVLGWHLDMHSQEGTVLLRPIISESHLKKESMGSIKLKKPIIRKEFADILVSQNGRYGNVESIFN